MAGAVRCPAHAGPVPLRAAGRGARRLPADPADAVDELGVEPGRELRTCSAGSWRARRTWPPRARGRCWPRNPRARSRWCRASCPPGWPISPAAPRSWPHCTPGCTRGLASTRRPGSWSSGAPPGAGKTTLAVHWAHQAAAEFPDGQLYVNLRGFDPTGPPVHAAEALRWFLGAFGVTEEQIPDSVEAQAALYRSVLADKRVLVILDNARDADQVRPLLPGSPSCLAVVTSRARLPGLAATEGARLVPLDVLTGPRPTSCWPAGWARSGPRPKPAAAAS